MTLNSLKFVHCKIEAKQLKYRIFQHKGVSCRTGNRLTCPPNSNIRQHALDFDHPIKLENFKLVNKSNKS